MVKHFLLLLLVVSFVAGCGGGGGGGSTAPSSGGGGASAPAPAPTPTNPAPAISSLAPDTAAAGGGQFLLTVHGSGFVPASVVNWGGSARTTTFVSSTQLQAAILAADIAVAASVPVTVTSPGPGGGVSEPSSFTVTGQAPSLGSVSPDSVAAGSSQLVLTVQGSHFVPTSTVLWNGAPRPTTFTSSTALQAVIPAADIAGARSALVSVRNPDGAVTASEAVFVFLNLPTNDLLYDPSRQVIYATIPGTVANGNSVGVLRPDTGQLQNTIPIGSEPTRMGITEDRQALFVALDGAGAVRRLDLGTGTPGTQFALGTDSFNGTMYAEDLVPLSGTNDSVAVSLFFRGVSPRHAGVAVYDGGVRRTTTTRGHTGSNRIEPGNSATRLYGYNNETTEFGFRRLSISASGVSETDVTRNLISNFGVDIELAGGRIYSTTGRVVEPESRTLLGTFPGISSAAVEADPTGNRTYFVDTSASGTPRTLRAFDATTFVQLGTATIPAGSDVRTLIRFGADGLALRTSGGRVFLFSIPHVLP